MEKEIKVLNVECQVEGLTGRVKISTESHTTEFPRTFFLYHDILHVMNKPEFF